MTRPIYGSRLLTTAANLAGVGAGRGRPPLSDLRRATSTAYYALFHQIVRHSSYDFLPVGSESEIAEIARWYSHTGLLRAANPVRSVTVNHVEDAKASLVATRSLWRARASSRPTRQSAHACYQSFLRLALLSSGPPRGR